MNEECAICLEKLLIPCITIHVDLIYIKQKVHNLPVCRSKMCESCLVKSLNLNGKCPICNLPANDYMILPWLIVFDENIKCPNCDWKGTVIDYYCVHTFEHNYNLKR